MSVILLKIKDQTGEAIFPDMLHGRFTRKASEAALAIVEHLRRGSVNPAAAVSIQFDACSSMR